MLGRDGKILGYTIGNDVSSREIEGANPLYLTQAKVFAGACAIGPAVYAPTHAPHGFQIVMRITDEDGEVLYEERTTTAQMTRSFDELDVVARTRQPDRRPVPSSSRGRGWSRPTTSASYPATGSRSTSRRSGRSSTPSSSHRRSSDRERRPSPMTETVTIGAPARNYIGGTWRPAASDDDVREAKPLAAVGGDGRLPGLGRGRRARSGRRGRGGVPRLGEASPRRRARRS